MDERAPIVVGLTGASGAPIAVRVLESLHAAGEVTDLVLSEGGRAVLQEECGIAAESLQRLVRTVYSDRELGAAIASGSRPTRGMVVVPCSSTTLARIALGLGDTLVARAAHVHLKEHRPLTIVPRETPLSAIQLRHMTTLAELGVTVLVAAPPYYTHPSSVQEMTDYLAGKVLDQFHVPHTLYRGWKAGESP
ncbi:MAG: UbiX family flavin prenyltransferase [Thermoplasmata archaeon]